MRSAPFSSPSSSASAVWARRTMACISAAFSSASTYCTTSETFCMVKGM